MRTIPEYLASDRCPGDRDAFLAYAQEAQEQFRPASFLELHFAAEIVRDTWRSSLIARIDENDHPVSSMEALRRSRDRLNAEIRRNTAELRRLQTDRIDLMQHHESIRLEDPDRVFAAAGAMEAVLAAKQAGKVRYIGFTGHKDPLVHLRMLEVAAQHQFHFDAVQMPLNVMDAHFRSFAKQVLPALVKNGIGVLGMKPLGSGAIVQSGAVSALDCLHYALNLPTSVVITGMETMARLDQALEAVRTFKPLDEPQLAALLAKTASLAATGQHERFKTSANFDGTARHPEWLG